MGTAQRKRIANKTEQKAPRNGLGFQRPRILVARQREPYAIGGFGFKGAQVLLARTDGKETGNGFKTDVERQVPGEGRLVREIRTIVERLLSEGNSLEEILDEAGLSKFEKRAFYVYVWCEKRIKQDEAAKRLGKKKVTLTHAIKRVANKLLGIDAYYHLIKKYAGLSDNELKLKIEEAEVKSKVELDKKNTGLYRIAKDRGVLDEMFPPLWLKELRDALGKALQERSLEDILADSENMDRNIIDEMALSKPPPSIKAFARKHGLKPDKISRRIKRLTKQLRGEEVKDGNGSNRLRGCIEDIDAAELAELKSLMDEKELALLERRAIPRAGESLESIGKTFSVSRQRMKQKEEELINRIERWREGGKFEGKTPEWPIVKRIKRVVEKRRSAGETVDEIKRNSGLIGLESEATDLCVLNENRITQKEAAEKLGTSPSTISKMLRSAEYKIASTGKEMS